MQAAFGSEGRFLCAEGATEISPGLLAQFKSYPGSTSHKTTLPLLAERGEGWGEESKSITHVRP
jgi:hypothetical protein